MNEIMSIIYMIAAAVLVIAVIVATTVVYIRIEEPQIHMDGMYDLIAFGLLWIFFTVMTYNPLKAVLCVVLWDAGVFVIAKGTNLIFSEIGKRINKWLEK